MPRRKLTKAQMERIQADLLERRRLLLADARLKLDEVNEEDGGRGGDDADRATVSFEHEMAMGAAARETRELKLIEEALSKIASGTYGTCEECNEPIALARLKALPFATYCIDCQERLEETGILDSTGGVRHRD